MPWAEEAMRLFDFVGSLVCHQKQERTLWIGGHYLPVCARDTGILSGFVLGYVLLFFLHRKEAKGPPDLYLSLAMTLPLWVDSFGQLFGFWTSTNDLRLITGLLFGTAVVPWLIYALSLSPLKDKIPVIGTLQPEAAALDDKDSWFGARELLTGIVLSFILFVTIRLLVGSELSLLYWILSGLIMAGVIWHLIVLPPILLLAALRRLFHKGDHSPLDIDVS